MGLYPFITSTLVGDFKGVVLETKLVRMVVIPDYGARIISLIYKPTETDFCWRHPDTPIKKPEYKIEYENVSGFFDCIPTCESCTFKGRTLPPLGDVALKPWKLINKEKNAKSLTITMKRVCDAYPISVRKSISLSNTESTIDINYTVQNLSNETLEYHYSGHNTLSINPYCRIILPHEVSTLRIGAIATDRLGKTGEKVSWPIAKDKHQENVDLSKVGTPCDKTAENLYTEKLKETWCAVINEAKKEAISFLFSSQTLPYILLWLNYGGWRDYYHIALEPCSGRPDNLKLAVDEWKNYAALEPKGKALLHQRIILKHNINHIEKITLDEGVIE
jgi:galactose mutarotase-like enzyme